MFAFIDIFVIFLQKDSLVDMKPECFLKQPIEYSTMFLDMDSFFASVEQFYNPKLRGKPVGVATGTTSGASIIAASIEAKCFGVRTGLKVIEARRKCPEIAIVHDSPNSYRYIHRQIMEILHNTPCYVRAKSIDEAYLLVPSYLQTKKQTLALAKAIKASIFDLYNEHMSCSIGIASNIWLAKMASDYQKPNGLVIITAKNRKKFLENHKLIDLTGINWRMARRLYAINIYCAAEFYNAELGLLRAKLGVNGEKWYLRMRGYEVDFSGFSINKSISQQITTVPNSPFTNEEITTFLNKIGVILGQRLRSKSLRAGGISVKIKFTDHQLWENTARNVNYFRSNKKIIEILKMLLKKLKIIPAPVKKICVTLFNLVDEYQIPLPLFDGDRFDLISETMDSINSRYGKNSIMPLKSYFANYINFNRVGFAGDLVRERANPTDKKHYF